MNRLERRSVFALSGIFALRIYGLFLILPVFAIYAEQLPGTSPFLIGIALGAYGLTQAVFQIPFGILSDRFGRKTMLTVGLLLFAVGSVVAAMSSGIVGVIVGRAIQGAGAIAAVILALTADLTREEQRTKSMAIIGATIGAVFLTALMTGPGLERTIGVPGMFWLTGFLALAALPVVWWIVPTPASAVFDINVRPVKAQMAAVLKDPQLLRLDLGIFVLHMVLTAMFVALPLVLIDTLAMPGGMHWKVYVPVLLASIVLMLPLLFAGMRRDRTMPVFKSAIFILIIAEILLWLGFTDRVMLLIGLVVFFVGFNLLEAMLPSLVSRLAPAGAKGTVMGVYNGFEFAGVFVGGALGGAIYGVWGATGLFLFGTIVAIAWWVIALTGGKPLLRDSMALPIERASDRDAATIAQRLLAIPGVEDVTVLSGEGVAYLKVDRDRLNEADLAPFERRASD